MLGVLYQEIEISKENYGSQHQAGSKLLQRQKRNKIREGNTVPGPVQTQDQTLVWTCIADAHLQCVNKQYAKFK